MKKNFPARSSELDRIITFIENFFQQKGISATGLQEILMAAEEVVTNIIHFAYDVDQEGSLEIELQVTDKRLIMIFQDHGRPFDPTTFQRPNIDLPLAERQPGGLGIYLVRKFMHMEYEYHENQKNTLTLMKEWPC